MITTLDKSGRILIPQQLLKLLGITAQTRLVISRQRNKIVIEPAAVEDLLTEKEGLLVFTGQLEGNFETWLSEERKERESRLLN